MKYAHIDSTNRILGWYSKDVHDVIPNPSIEVTDDEWLLSLENNFNTVDDLGKTYFVDYSTIEERKVQIRSDRDTLLLELDRIVSNPIRWNSFTSDVQSTLVTYRQELLDVPQQIGFPDNVIWPNKPDIMKV